MLHLNYSLRFYGNGSIGKHESLYLKAGEKIREERRKSEEYQKWEQEQREKRERREREEEARLKAIEDEEVRKLLEEEEKEMR